ncbi:DUF3089 domain-containing protein [Sphingomonas antarctica]|uniref:DUF3089 domain-containing protein n=1 Tax=Sphingomonas antarctica TaxID=2040274 RepID=UPI0039E97F7A
MARKFLYIIAAIIFLIIAGLVTYRLAGPQLMRAAMVPSADFQAQPPMPANDWADAKMWLARPDIRNNPSEWLPDGYQPVAPGNAAVFYVHPTSYLDRSAWNAPLDDATANDRAALFARGQASAFNGVGKVWAPRYRQATFGAFLSGQRESQLALDAAYRDVVAAWDAFLIANPSGPIIIAGHSQGALHIVRLIHDRIAGQPVASRIVAAYAIGWPISVEADLPVLIPACATRNATGCLVSWQSFAEPADPSQIVDLFDRSPGYTGKTRQGTRILCTNPLTGTPGGSAPPQANLGAVVPSSDLKSGKLEIGTIGARCDDRGFLLIGAPPEGFGTYVLPGNNYHVFDYSLFWSNLRADAAIRLAAFGAK